MYGFLGYLWGQGVCGIVKYGSQGCMGLTRLVGTSNVWFHGNTLGIGDVWILGAIWGLMCLWRCVDS